MDNKVIAALAIGAVVIIMGGVLAAALLMNKGSSTVSDEGGELADYSEYDTTVESIPDLTVECVSGTSNCASYVYNTETKEYTLKFGAISANTEYSIKSSSVITGNVVIDTGSTYDFKLTLNGFSCETAYQPCIAILSGHNATVSAATGTDNEITDSRDAVTNGNLISCSLYSICDLDVQGNGSLTVISEYNNGIHGKDDLEVKNLTLEVSCANNALKGNDSVTIKSGTLSLRATGGDGIKTMNSDTDQGAITINASEGNTSVTVRAYYDAITSAKDVIIGSDVTGGSLDVKIYTYTNINSTAVSGLGVQPAYVTVASPPNGGGAGGSGAGQGGADTSGNSAKSTDSTKGIKADNVVTITAGAVYINTPADDGIHANNTVQLDTGSYGSGDVNINGGTVTINCGDDGIHTDGTINIAGGEVTVSNAYEGIEGSTINVKGGNVCIKSSDDGINSSGVITLSGGNIYIYCAGDGIDSNYTSGRGIIFSGANVGIVSTSGGNCVLDADGGFTYSAGKVLAICPQGMQNEVTSYLNNSTSAYTTGLGTLASGKYLVGSDIAIKMPVSLSKTFAVYMGGTTTPSIDTSTSLTKVVGDLYL